VRIAISQYDVLQELYFCVAIILAHGLHFNPLGKLVYGGAVLTDQLGTPRGRCDEHSSKFSLSYETKV
jgi:hypothetical protein